MKCAYGISVKDYTTSPDGHRVGSSPLFHHPDECPFFGKERYGDCMEKCGFLATYDRPCNAHHKVPAVGARLQERLGARA